MNLGTREDWLLSLIMVVCGITLVVVSVVLCLIAIPFLAADVVVRLWYRR